MKRTFIIAASALALGVAGILSTVAFSPLAAQSASAQIAAARTTSFAIENMTCALCPVTVKTAMERVKGVQLVQVNFDAKTATVVFDSSVTTVEAIAAASTNAGYPAKPQS
jgi:periplasmic mercuric ion binding protein